jgi:hypothetical protein
LLFCGFARAEILTNALQADFQAGVGITLSNSGPKILSWQDQHQTLSNDGLGPWNATGTNGPLDWRDPYGRPCVWFPFAVTSTNTYLEVGSEYGLRSNVTNQSIYVVCTGPMVAGASGMTIIQTPTNHSDDALWFANGVSTPMTLTAAGGSGGPTNVVPANVVVLASINSRQASTAWFNYISNTTSRFTDSTGTNGISIGRHISPSTGAISRQYFGYIYRILIYATNHTDAQVKTNISELAAAYRVVTNHAQNVICRGDSITAGTPGSALAGTLAVNYPTLLQYKYPETAWFGLGHSGAIVGSNNVSSSSYYYDSNHVDAFFTNSLVRGKPASLVFLMGVNDIGASSTNVTYQRITNYLGFRKTRGWTNIYALTLTDYVTRDVGGVNGPMRIDTAGWWSALVDVGLGSSYEKRLSTNSNTTYFQADGLHLTTEGERVLENHVGRLFNAPRRGAFF